jgi:hypothetical protein
MRDKRRIVRRTFSLGGLVFAPVLGALGTIAFLRVAGVIAADPVSKIIEAAMAIFVSLVVAVAAAGAVSGDSATDIETVRQYKRSARWNEQVKLLANCLNAIAGATFLAVVVAPIAQHQQLNASGFLAGFGAAAVLHIVAQGVLLLWRDDSPA